MAYLFNKNSNLRKKGVALLIFFSMLLSIALPFISSRTVHAVTLTEASIRLGRMGADTAANTTSARILVVFKPESTATEAKLVMTWPTSSAFVVDATPANHLVTDTGIPANYQGESLTASGITSPATGVAGGEVTFTLPDVDAGTLYGFFITGGITNPSAGNAGTHVVSIATTTSGDSEIDLSNVAVDTVGTDGDQVSVTASVPSSFNMAIADTALPLGALSTSTVAAESMSSPIDIDTNAASGWIIWIRSEGAGIALTSASTSYDIDSTDTGSPVTCSAGTDCYVIDAASAAGGGSSGSVTEATEYAGNGTTSGGVISTTYEKMASSDGPAVDDTVTLTAIVAISGIAAAAADYTDTLEVIGAGNF